MKEVLKIILFLIVFIGFISCKKESPVETDSNLPKFQPQTGEFDLIGLENKKVTNFAINEIEPWRIIASTDENMLYVTNDYGKTWSNIEMFNYPAAYLMWDKVNSNMVYFSNRNTLARIFNEKFNRWIIYFFKSSDYGYSWMPADSGIPQSSTQYIKVFTVDPYVGGVIYGGTEECAPFFSGSLIKSKENCSYWYELSEKLSRPGEIPLDISINYLTPPTILYSDASRGIYRTTDIGNSWKFFSYPDNNFIQHCLSKYSLFGFGIISQSVNEFLGITNDAFATFTKINNDDFNRSSFSDILINLEDQLFVTATYKGSDSSYVYISKDKGSTWSKLGSDINKKTLLGYDPKNNFLYVVMDGVKKGLYRYQLK